MLKKEGIMKIQKLGKPLLSKTATNIVPQGPITRTNLARTQEIVAKAQRIKYEKPSPWIAPEHIENNSHTQTLDEIIKYSRKALNHIGIKITG